MADKKLSVEPPPSSQQNGRIGVRTSRHSLSPHHNGTVEAGLGRSPSSTRASSSTSPLRSHTTLGDLMTPVLFPGPENRSSRPRGQSLGSVVSSRTGTTTSRSKVPPLKPDPECQRCDWLFVSEVSFGSQLFFCLPCCLASEQPPGGARSLVGLDPGGSGSAIGGSESQPQPIA